MQIQVEVNQVGSSTAEGLVRGHRVLVDRPVEKGGENQGMMGGEYLLVALGGCFMSNLLAAMGARAADIHDVRLRVVGTLGSAPSRFSRIDVTVSARTGDGALLDKLVGLSDRACIVSNTLRSAVELHYLVQAEPTITAAT